LILIIGLCALVISFSLALIIHGSGHGYLCLGQDNTEFSTETARIRAGGPVIFPAFFISLLIYTLYFSPGESFNVYIFTVSLALAFLYGAIHDFIHMRYMFILKIIIQLSVCSLVMASGLSFGPFSLSGFSVSAQPVLMLLTCAWVLLCMNASRVLEGPGSADSWVYLATFLFLLVHSHLDGNHSALALSSAAAGAITGFIITDPAGRKLRPGHAASAPFGLLIACAALMGLNTEAVVCAWVLPLALMTLILAGIPLHLLAGAEFRANYFVSMKNMFNYRAAVTGLSIKETIFIFLSVTAIFGLISIIMRGLSRMNALLLFAVILCMIFILLYVFNLLMNVMEEKTGPVSSPDDYIRIASSQIREIIPLDMELDTALLSRTSFQPAGISFMSVKRFRKGQIVLLRLALPGSEKQVAVRLIVTWTGYHLGEVKQGFLTGARIIAIQDSKEAAFFNAFPV